MRLVSVGDEIDLIEMKDTDLPMISSSFLKPIMIPFKALKPWLKLGTEFDWGCLCIDFDSIQHSQNAYNCNYECVNNTITLNCINDIKKNSPVLISYTHGIGAVLSRNNMMLNISYGPESGPHDMVHMIGSI